MYVDQHPLSLNLDIDQIRSLIGHWRQDRHAAGLLARAITLAAARTHLAAGHDVVIPQFLAQPTFLEQVERLATELGADFHEIVLIDSKDNALRRFTQRPRSATDPHQDTHEVLDRIADPQAWSTIYDELMSLVASRPTATVIPTDAGQAQRAYRDLLNTLS